VLTLPAALAGPADFEQGDGVKCGRLVHGKTHSAETGKKCLKNLLPLAALSRYPCAWKMAYFSTEPASERRNPAGKNRVWDFFELSSKTHPANRRQPEQPRRKIRPTAMKPVSGIPYWPSRDPIGEIGGLNLYGFVKNGAISSWDKFGLLGIPSTCGYGAMSSDCDGSSHAPTPPDLTKEQKLEVLRDKFKIWYDKAKKDTKWIEKLPDCPCDISCTKTRCTSSGSWNPYERFSFETYDSICIPEGWTEMLKAPSQKHHPGGVHDVREKGKAGKPGQQCMYDAKGKLITEKPGAGTPDFASVSGLLGISDHYAADVDPFEWALELDGNPDVPNVNGVYFQEYMEVRTPNKGKDSSGQPCPKNPK